MEEFEKELLAILDDHYITTDETLGDSLATAIRKSHQLAIDKAVQEARIDENQRRLDMIEAFRNRTPKPGELTAANFGSAGAGMVEQAYEHSFKERIAALSPTNHGGTK